MLCVTLLADTPQCMLLRNIFVLVIRVVILED